MEIKINKEIRDYSESIFFGLSIRQLVFSVMAIVVAVILYFTLRTDLGAETVSWVCILGAAPFAAMGFVNYHGMTAERLFWAVFKSEILEPKTLIFVPENAYFEALRGTLEAGYRKEYKNHVKVNEKPPAGE